MLITKQYIVDCKLNNNDKVQEPSVLCLECYSRICASGKNHSQGSQHIKYLSLKRNGKPCQMEVATWHFSYGIGGTFSSLTLFPGVGTFHTVCGA